LESVEGGDEEQMAKRQQQPRQEEERETRRRRQEETRNAELISLTRPRPTGLGMTTHHLILETTKEPHNNDPAHLTQ